MAVFQSPALCRHLGDFRTRNGAESAKARDGSHEPKDRDKAVKEFHSFFRPPSSNSKH